MKGPLERPVDAGAQPVSEDDLQLTPLRRRGESHRLGFVSIAAIALLALAVAKPWGDQRPAPSSAPVSRYTPSAASSDYETPYYAPDIAMGPMSSGLILIAAPSGWTLDCVGVLPGDLPSGQPDPSGYTSVRVFTSGADQQFYYSTGSYEWSCVGDPSVPQPIVLPEMSPTAS